MSSVNILWSLQTDKVLEHLNNGKRIDGRKFDEYREIKLQRNVSECAEGSARVSLGNSDVIAGVKFSLGEPYPDSPEKGAMSVGGELLPLASPEFDTGPPSAEAIELSRVVDRNIREGGTIDFEELCITPKEKVWIVFIDFYALNYDGNLFDAGALACMAALQNAKIPKFEDGDIVKGEYSGNLKLKKMPLLSMFAKIGNHVVLDPNVAEEHALNARLHVSCNEDDQITAFQKGGNGSFTTKEIEDSVDIALKSTKALRKILLE